MVFKLGDSGQGYYRDTPGVASAKLFSGSLSFYPSPTFAGARTGMVYKKGDRGMGYYIDNPFGGASIGEKCARPNRHQ
jgi:hypothetical protein